jgi:hypothetical protein
MNLLCHCDPLANEKIPFAGFTDLSAQSRNKATANPIT